MVPVLVVAFLVVNRPAVTWAAMYAEPILATDVAKLGTAIAAVDG